MNPLPRFRSLGRLPLLPLALATLPLIASPAWADHEDDATAFVSYVENDFNLYAAGGDEVDGKLNTPVLPGDKVETTRGRLEIVLPDGGILRMDKNTRVSFESIAQTAGADDDRTALRLETGSIFLELAEEPAGDDGLLVETFAASAAVLEDGLYRFDAEDRGTLLVHVRKGRAEVRNRYDRVRLGPGEWAMAEPDVERIDVSERRYDPDRFDRWIDQRMSRRTSSSHRYLNGSFSYAESSFDDYGTWNWAGDYDCYVWRPRVSFSWRPYVDGRWYNTPAGLSWIGEEAWGYVPYHYGTWVYTPSWGWCWTYGSTWSPAWVYWYSTSSALGWCPVGYYDWYYGHRSYWRDRDNDFCFRVGLRDLDSRGWCFVPTEHAFGRIREHVADVTQIVRSAGMRDGIVTRTPLRFGDGRHMKTPDLVSAIRELPKKLEPRIALGGLDDAKTFFRRDRVLPKSFDDRLREKAETGVAAGTRLPHGNGRKITDDSPAPRKNVDPDDRRYPRDRSRSDELGRSQDRAPRRPADDRPRKSTGGGETRRFATDRSLADEQARPGRTESRRTIDRPPVDEGTRSPRHDRNPVADSRPRSLDDRPRPFDRSDDRDHSVDRNPPRRIERTPVGSGRESDGRVRPRTDDGESSRRYVPNEPTERPNRVVTPRSETPRYEPRPEPRYEPSRESRPEPRYEPRPEPRYEPPPTPRAPVEDRRVYNPPSAREPRETRPVSPPQQNVAPPPHHSKDSDGKKSEGSKKNGRS